MMITMGLTPSAVPCPGGTVLPPPTVQVLQSVASDGWQAVWPGAPASLDPVGSPETITVTRQGHDATGAAAAVNDTLTVMARVRQPYPNQNSLATDMVALSDFVYAGDTLPAGVANNSTLSYPQPIACWLTPDMERATGTIFTARLSVAHAYARNGRPVAAVRFIASDGTTSVEQTVSAMTSGAFASGLHAPWFEAKINLAALAQGAVCTLDAIIYPWVGQPFRASLDASAYPSPNFTVLKFLNDRTGAYGTAYAYVDAVAGNNGTAVVSQSASAAAAAPFLTIAAAASAINAFNGTTFGRPNTSGGVIRLVAGEHVHSNYGSLAIGEIPLVIEPATEGAKATTIYRDAGTNMFNSIPGRLKIRGITLRKVGVSVTFLDNGAGITTLDRMLVLDDVAIDLAGTSGYGAWIYKTGRCWLINVSSATSLGQTFDNFSGVAKLITAIGCHGPWGGTNIYNAIACKLTAQLRQVASATHMPAGQGQMIAHSHITQSAGGSRAFISNSGSVNARGLALVGSVFEQTAAATAPAVSAHADGNVDAVQNYLCIGNTIVGARLNFMYQDIGAATVPKQAFLRFSVSRERNTKSDIFGANSALVGNWPVIYNVGARANAALLGANDGLGIGAGHWLGEVAALGDAYGTSAIPLVAAWADDQSFDGGRAGGGDYTPRAGAELPFVPAGLAPYPVDLKGRPVPNDGSARVGAVMAL